MISLNEQKLYCINNSADMGAIYQNLKAFEVIANGDMENSSPIAKLDAPSRFRWLTATRSTIIQCSKVHPGLSNNLFESLNKLMQDMVF